MKIHIVRHAEAVDRSPEVAEEHRYLTPKGRSKFRDVAATLAKAGVSPDVIVSSPLVRAVQTADILAEELGHKGELVLSTEVGPGFGVEQVEAIVKRYGSASELAFVGHEPDVGEVVAALMGLEKCALSKGMTLSFKLSGHGKGEFMHMVTGGGKLVKSLDQAVERLTRPGE